MSVTATITPANTQLGGPFAPLRESTFRTIWSASLFSNFGQLILGVGAAWEMTRLSSSASMVALVQTALMLPLVIMSVPAGAVADMLDRRKIAMVGLGFSVICSVILTILAYLGYSTPWVLLAFCSLIGAGVALYSPAWQASIREQVEPEHLPAAVALGSVSYNVARSFGPALGGIIVAAAGAQAAFGVNAVCYVPLFIAFLFWKRRHVASRLPPERLDRAIQSGMRYAVHSPTIRVVLFRVFLFGLAGASYFSLGALVARNLLHGTASTFGLLLGCGGVGAVAGALAIGTVRERLGAEAASRLCALASAIALASAGFSSHVLITSLCFFLAGGANMLIIGLMNVTVQLSAPRWVTARILSLFSSALTAGIAIGAIVWGEVANGWGIDIAMMASGSALFVTMLVGFVLPMPQSSTDDFEPVVPGSDPNVALDLTLRSGPISLEIDYHVDPAKARDFTAS